MNGKGKYWKPGSAQPTAEKITESSTKATLSKGVLGMKFMKRKLEASDQAKTDDIKRKKLLDKSWEEDKKIINFNVIDNNVHFTYEKEDLFSVLPGRRSFKAFNINIDRIYEQTMNANNFNSLVKPKFNEQQQQQFVDLYLKDNLKAGKMKNNDNNSSISNDNSKSRKDDNNNNNKFKGKK